MKNTVTMYHSKSDQSIEVHPSQVENAKHSGWHTEKLKPRGFNATKKPEVNTDG